ncbi:MAG: chromosomal replication initiator protein DnaA [Bacillota bacterium]|nr:chromosomal replication initiator protein DnaA [Bacillota bacterium]
MMTITELKTKWKQVLDACPTDKINAVKLDQWYRPLTPVSIDEENAVIAFAATETNPMQKNMINTNYHIIEQAIVQIFGKPYTIRLVEEQDIGEVPDFTYTHYTFDSFVSGPNNRLALAASLAIAEQFTPEYNPLFIYGGSGLGKTHLLTAIAHYVKEKNPEKKVLYITTEAFTNELIKAIKGQSTEEFHEKYRKVDILLLDDIQFLAGKEQTVEEVFNTFNALYSANKQIVLSSDKPPKDLKDLPDRLITRFSQGMIADIQAPDYETRVAILQQKIEEKGLSIDQNLAEVLDLIAQNVTDNIRELEGALTRVLGMAGLSGEKITKDYAKSILKDVFIIKEREVTPENIKKAVAEFYGIKISDLESSKRSRVFVGPRQVAMFLIRTHTSLSLPQIGQEFGGRDHTTVLYSCEKIEEEIQNNKEFADKLKIIEAQFGKNN